MENQLNRNTRTLIVSFVIAIMALIPLRFIEVGNMQVPVSSQMVLGDSVEITPVGLEAPYDEIDKINCLSVDEADGLIADFLQRIETTGISEEEKSNLIDSISVVEENRCN